MRNRLILCSVLVAVVGLSSALLIYLTASEDSDLDENVQTVVVDGKTFRIPLASTKMYRRELQRFGGGAPSVEVSRASPWWPTIHPVSYLSGDAS
jgi:hypothetical protein